MELDNSNSAGYLRLFNLAAQVKYLSTMLSAEKIYLFIYFFTTPEI